MLLLPGSFSSLELFSAITGLSYTGDWRMVFGEDPHKVRNIARGSLPAFFDLYSQLLREQPFASLVSVEGEGAEFWCDTSPRARLELGLQLPLQVQRRMGEAFRAQGSSNSSSGGPLPLQQQQRDLAAGSLRGHARYTAMREPLVSALWGSVARGGSGSSAVVRHSLTSALSGIVGPSARGQSILGILTAGPAKSTAYAAQKIIKSIRGLLRG